MATEAKLLAGKHICSVLNIYILSLILRGPTLCSGHLYSNKNYNVTGINSMKQHRLIPLQIPCSHSALNNTETSNYVEKIPPQP